ncbi:MAG: hypothetical protein JWM47_1333 [Acidimicrobiales bacterium]|nr:hypothetical protein [Acidimicrobiales bacterium]
MLPPLAAGASPSDPAQWPEGPGVEPELTATPHTIRFSGPDRYQTNLALTLALRGRGDFPFDTSDRTTKGATGLAQANDWWGPATCPRSIIVVAGDTFADALAAASLSDPNDRSSQPRVQRVASANPLFDIVGGFDRVDTASAPIIVTASARSGATALSQSARLSATDMAKGGCTTAREAIIVGGLGAVPNGVESELVSLGYDEVFRVAGDDRYGTAADVANALGTGTPPPAGTGCLDTDATDGATHMGWYGNAVAEYRRSLTECYLLPRSVVLADGGTGADALAAGWWTSYWKVPILLTAPDGSLPPATRTALQTMDIDTIIVLGGTSRIPQATIDAARAMATAQAGPIKGNDRFETSLLMAQAFGGWFPTGKGRDFADDLFCLAGSSGNDAGARGWPDALAGGPWCSRLGLSGVGSPDRAFSPVTGGAAASATTGGRHPSHDAVPVLLVPTGGAMPASVASFLTDAFEPATTWCSADAAPAGCVGPGFGVVLGGPSSVTEAVARQVADLVSGGNGGDGGDQSPAALGFPTRLDLSPVYPASSLTDGPRACFPSGAIQNVRWLSVTDDVARRSFQREVDVLRARGYGSTGANAPTCVRLGDGTTAAVAGVSVSGRVGAVTGYDLTAPSYVSISGDVVQDAAPGAQGATSWTFTGAPQRRVDLLRGGARRTVTDATFDLALVPAPGDDAGATVTGHYTLVSSGGRLEGTISATAVRSNGVWLLRGQTVLLGLIGPRVAGGFRGQLTTGGTAQLVWVVDGTPLVG